LSKSFQHDAVLIAAFCVLSLPYSVHAQSGADPSRSPTAFDTLWDKSTLYHSDTNPYVKDFSLVGRYHGQYWNVESGGTRNEGWENRRMVFGFNSSLFDSFALEVQMKISEDFDPFYDELYVAFLEWTNRNQSFTTSAGRLDYVYTGLERSTSSKVISTLERSLVVNQVMPGEVVGLYTSGIGTTAGYQIGVFSGSIEQELTHFDGGVALLAGFNYPLALGFESGTIHLDYLYNDGDPDNNAFEPYQDILSLWHQGTTGRLSMGMDLTWAYGIGSRSDLYGVTLLPTYDLGENLLIGSDKLQLALRYHHASSESPGGLEFNRRYEQEVVSGTGDRYNAWYIGLNYLVNDHKLKLMTGIEYFDMSGVMDNTTVENGESSDNHVDGWTFLTGLRLYF
jgi:phosphate-selective porin OprO/OprP